MEGLIPFVYKAIMQYKNGKEGPIGSWLCESPSYSYMRLPGGGGGSGEDSGWFQPSDYGFSATSPSSKPSTSSGQIKVSSGFQSPRHRSNSHKV